MALLNVGENRVGSKGLASLLSSLCEEPKCFASLENLGLDGAKFDSDTSKLLGDLLVKTNKLTDVSLVGSPVDFRFLKRAENLTVLSMNGFKFSLKGKSKIRDCVFLSNVTLPTFF